MSKLEQLIVKLCPDGVEYKTLGDVCLSITAGGDLPEHYNKGQKKASIEFPYPIYSNGTDESALYGFTDNFKVSVEAITISARGTIGFHKVRAAKFTPIVRLLVLIPDIENITGKYLNYALDMVSFASTDTGIPSLTVPNIKKAIIPLPPLPVQHEIVHILDKFTELTARKTQYEYYRDKLLTFKERTP